MKMNRESSQLLAEVDPEMFNLPGVGDQITDQELGLRILVESKDAPFGRLVVTGEGIRAADVLLALKKLLREDVSARARERAVALNGGNHWYRV